MVSHPRYPPVAHRAACRSSDAVAATWSTLVTVRVVVALACLTACRLGFDESPGVGETGTDAPTAAACAGSLTLGAGTTSPPGVYGAADAPLLTVGPGP